MSKIVIKLKDGSEKTYESGITANKIVEDISRNLAKETVAVKINDEVKDLNISIKENATLEFLKFEDEEGKKVFRHSSAHVLAQAVQRLFPDVKLGIGPAIEDGFYYDFDSEYTFTPEDLKKIEKEMKKIVSQNLKFERQELNREEALELFNKNKESYKVQLINELPEDANISIYKQGDWVDLCAGPHLLSTKKIKAIKLLNLAGAYWKGNESNKMLQRIYATSFPKKTQLEEYLNKLEEAKKRDHRKLGHQLELFTMNEVGPGFPFFLPKGMILRNALEEFWRKEHSRWGYNEIKTPIILNRGLWEQSGHWDHYKENMYFTKIDEEDYAIKPMNCPGSIMVYKNDQHSYREFPLRIGELGLVHRHELSGVLHGLMRVRAFTQDDAHIFMLPSQITNEIKNVIDMIDQIYSIFGFEYNIELSTKPEKAMGSDEIWNKATNSLKEAMEQKELDFTINEGDGAFYGPKIDFHLRDSLGRTWQCGTIQLDFLMPEKFDLNYIGEDGEKHRPVMIHTVKFGSIERFIGILIEHYAGAFPLWMAPVQVKILPIADRHIDYVMKIKQLLQGKNIRAEIDDRNEKIGYKIREAQLNKIPYMLVVGDNEIENRTVSVRKRGVGDIGSEKLDEFIENLRKEVKVPETKYNK